MNQKEIGCFISGQRKRHNLTQKALADMLYVTDKAVSKWERGVSSPDSSILQKLAFILNCDVDDLITSQKSNEWVGLLDLESISKYVDINIEINNTPIVLFLLCYFALVKITKIKIIPSNSNLIDALKIRDFGFEIINKIDSCKNTFIIDKPYFIYGSSLTKLLEYCMNSSKDTYLLSENNSVVFKFIKNGIIKQGSTDLELKNLWRGIITIPISKDSINDVDILTSVISTYSKHKIMDLKDVFYNRFK